MGTRKGVVSAGWLLALLLVALLPAVADAETISVEDGYIAAIGSTTAVIITLDAVPAGLSGYLMTVSLSDGSIAEITGVDFPGWASMNDNSALPADSFWMKAVDLNDQVKLGYTNVELGTLTIQGDAEGECVVNITIDRLDDDGGYPIIASVSPGTLRVDLTPPTVTVERKAGQPDPTNALPIRFTVTFSETVTGLEVGDFTLDGTATGPGGSLTGSGSSYELSIDTITGDGTVEPSLPAAAAADLAGHPSEVSTSIDNSVTYDSTAPTLSSVSIASNNVDNTLAKVDNTVTLTFVSDEDLQASPVVAIAGEVAGAVTQGGDAKHWTATRVMQTGDTEGAIEFTIGFTDAAGNPGTPVTQTTDSSSVTFDETAPTISGVTLDPITGTLKVNDTVDITVTAGGNEAGLTPSDATFNDQSVALVDQTNGTYKGTYTVVEGHPDVTGAEATAITLTDATGNVSTTGASSNNAVDIDANSPTIATVTSDATAAGVLIVSNTITFTVTPTTPEAGLTVAPVTYNGGALVWSTSNSGATYTATYEVEEGHADQGPALQLTGVTLTDAAGNTGASADGSDVAKTIDANSPTIATVTSDATAAGVLIVSNTITFTVTPTTPEAGLTVAPVTYNGGALVWSTSNSGATYTATYEVEEGHADRGPALQLTGVTLTDAAGNTGASADGSDVAKTIDANSPTIATVTSDATAAGVLIVSNTITFTVTPTTPEAGLTVAPVTYNGGALSWSTSDSGSTYTATYEVEEGHADQGPALQLTGVTLTDAAGNTGASADGSDVAKTIDANSPTIATVTSDATAAGVLIVSNTITFTVTPTTPEAGLTVAPVTYNGGALSWSTSNSGATYTATYEVEEGHADQGPALQLTGVTLTDAAGNTGASADGSDVAKTIDANSPTIATVTSDATAAGVLIVSNTITFTVTPTTPEAGLTVAPVTYNGGALSWSTSDSGSTYTATYEVEEGHADQGPALQLTGVTLTDAAGNTGASADGSDVAKTIDANSPTIATVTSDATAAGVLIVSNTITFTVTPTTPEAGLTVAPVTYNGGALSWSTSNSGATYTATYEVEEGQADRGTALQLTGVTLTDAAGNTGASADGSDVAKTIDANSPTIATVTSDATPADVLKVGETITFTVTPTTPEAGLTVAPVTYNGGALSWSTSNSGATYTATYEVEEGQADRGTALQLTGVTLTDAAGNTGASADGSDVAKTIDANSPTIATVTSDATPADVLKVGETITFTVTPTTPEAGLTVAPVTYNGGTLSWSTSNSGATYTATYEVEEGQADRGTALQLTGVTLTDAAGNTGASADGSDVAKTIDANSPTIATVTSDATPADVLKVGETITFTVTPTTPEAGLTVAPVTYNGGTLSWSTSNSGATYTATYEVEEGQADRGTALQLTGVTLTDAAGNTGASADGSDVAKTIDANSPTLTPVTIVSDNTTDPTLAIVFDTVTISFTADESLTVSPVVTIDGNLADAVNDLTSNNYTATRVMQVGDTVGLIAFTIDFTDEAGNPGIQVTGTTNSSSVTFEETLPTIPGPHGVPPRDLDGDGLYEDLNGNGRLDFADVVLLFNEDTWIGDNEPISCFDFNGNGVIVDFADIVALFDML